MKNNGNGLSVGNKASILVVEDQIEPLEIISLAIRRIIFEEDFKGFFSDTPQEDLEERGVAVARCYSDAENLIKSGK